MNRAFALLLVCPILIGASLAARATVIPTVRVGDPGNADDALTGYGGVSYAYRIGTTEVTNAQYADFLNAQAVSDPFELYDPTMGTDPRGGITRSGESGSFTYAPRPDMANKPVVYVSWYDAIRFANWLNNGQGTGSTEVGAYTLKTGVFTINSINRNPGAIWFLPNEDEWYKAAYYQPAAKGGDADDYWLYPTASNSAPTLAQAVDAAGPTRGDIANPGVNIANYLLTADWNGQNGNITTAGSAGSSSQSFYGTSDQAGNVHEWNETRIDSFFRGVRGGGWNSFAYFGESTYRWHGTPTGGSSTVGFRVATILVPEPSTLLLAASGLTALVGVAVARHRRR